MSVSQVLETAARLAGEAARQRREVWGQTIANLGQIPEQIYAGRQAARREQRQTAYDDARLALERAQLALKQGEVQRADQEYALSKQLNEYQGQVLQAAQGDEPGSFNVDKARQAAASLTNVNPSVAPKVMAWVEEYDKQVNPPPVFHPPGSRGVVPRTGQVVPGSEIPERPPAPSEAGFAGDLSSPDPAVRARAQTALDAIKAGKTTPQQSEWDMFTNTFARGLNKPNWQALTPQEQEKAFSMYADLKADPAADRQARALAASVAAETRRQSFTEAQVGRKELTDKVEAPYQTAVASANTLRDVVDAARRGNKVAASLQSLETTFAAVRAQGLNRVNMAEIGLPANAGNAWDRLQSWFGKATEGQPVPENIQKDMEQFADILEKAAYKRYISGHASVTKRYGLKDETPLPAPSREAASLNAPDLTGLAPGQRRRFTDGPFAGQVWTIGSGGQPVKVQ